MDLRHCEYRTQIPDLSQAVKLQSIGLSNCTKLYQDPSSRFHNFEEYTSLKQSHLNFVNRGYSTLGQLKVTGGPKIKKLKPLTYRSPQTFDHKQQVLPRNLTALNLSYTSIEEKHFSSIEHLSGLKYLMLNGCTRLESLPTSICRLRSLRYLILYDCSNLETFPNILEPMEHLQLLDLGKTGIRRLTSSVDNLIGLQWLNLEFCENFEFLSNNISNLNHLKEIFLYGCSKLKIFPSLVGLHSMTTLDLGCCKISNIPNEIGSLSSLKSLILRENSFERIPSSIKNLYKLVDFEICYCKNLKSLPELPSSLLFLDASGCISLEMISNSRTVLIQEWWDEYRATEFKEFLYYDCINLDQNTRDNIVTEFQRRTLCAATLSMFNYGKLEVCLSFIVKTKSN